jgi:hypothetical protein
LQYKQVNKPPNIKTKVLHRFYTHPKTKKMKQLKIAEMECISGGISCSRAAGWLFGGGVIFMLIPGLQPLGATLIASSALGAAC